MQTGVMRKETAVRKRLAHIVGASLTVLAVASQYTLFVGEGAAAQPHMATQNPNWSGGGLLDGVVRKLPFQTGQISSSDPTGGNADAWPVQPGETRTLADIKGTGMITHIWVTIDSSSEYHLRQLILRAYWDNEKTPSVECPIGDFFGLGHGMYYQYACMPLQMGTTRAMNSFWKMPFSDRAKLTITNQGDEPVRWFYFHID